MPKQFFLEMIEPNSPEQARKNEEVKLKTCLFQVENFPGTSFAFKIKKSGAETDMLDYHTKFHYLRVEVKKNEEETMIDIMEASKHNFPIYMDNLTDYPIKITEKIPENEGEEE